MVAEHVSQRRRSMVRTPNALCTRHGHAFFSSVAGSAFLSFQCTCRARPQSAFANHHHNHHNKKIMSYLLGALCVVEAIEDGLERFGCVIYLVHL